MLTCWIHCRSGFPSGTAVKKPPVTQAVMTQASLVAQTVTSLPAMWEIQVWSPGEGNGNPLQCSCLENPMDGEAWQATVQGVAKSWTRLRDWTDWTRRSPGVELAIHSSILAWNIPWMEKPGRLQSVRWQRVGYSWACTHGGIFQSQSGVLLPQDGETEPARHETNVPMSPSHSRQQPASSVSFISFWRVVLRWQVSVLKQSWLCPTPLENIFKRIKFRKP